MLIVAMVAPGRRTVGSVLRDGARARAAFRQLSSHAEPSGVGLRVQPRPGGAPRPRALVPTGLIGIDDFIERQRGPKIRANRIS